MKTAVYPGTFDPITLGHVDIIQRIGPLFDKLIILLAEHPTKKHFFSATERVQLVQKAVATQKNVTIEVYSGLTVDFVKKAGAQVIIRGLRAVTDYEYELVMANTNKKLAPEIETMIVFAKPEFYYISSNVVKEVAQHGASVKGLVPDFVERALIEKFQK